jgi:hypothetical protein
MSDTQPAPADPAIDPMSITLSEPILVIDHMVSKITLTRPRGRHLMKAGAALRVITRTGSDELAIEVNPESMGKLISACFNLPNRTVEELPAADFVACSNKLMPFLVDATS